MPEINPVFDSPIIPVKPVEVASSVKYSTCGHPENWLLKLEDSSGTKRFFCLGCLFEKTKLSPTKTVKK